MPDPRPAPPEREPVEDLVARAEVAAHGSDKRGMWTTAEIIRELAAALEATAAERDRAHATLREIAKDPYSRNGRIARERLERP